MKNLLDKLINKNDLSFSEAYFLMNSIMEGKLNNSQISASLIALKMKGEKADEIAGFVKAMRDNSLKIRVNGFSPIDVCGTGGDNSGTFNISTAASFVIAASGIHVAKHGNRSISSKSGSADVLRELGVNIELNKKQAAYALAKTGITFLFAPLYHPAMKYAAPVRKELGMKTVFNILGPLTNPAGTKKQVIGTFNNHTANLMAEAAEKLEMERVCFVCTDDKYDEITLTGTTNVFEYNSENGVQKFKISAKTFGLKKLTLSDIKGDSAEINAKIILSIFSGNDSPALNVTAANAAMGLYISGYSNNLKECFDRAVETIKTGKALKKLNELISIGKDL